VEFTVRAQGPTFADLTSRAERSLRTANRAAAADIGKVGRKAMDASARASGRGWHGRTLRTKTKIDSSPAGARVTFNPAKGQAGAWAIADTGASAHMIRPRRGKALRFDGRYAPVVHHLGARGVGVWAKATRTIDRAVKPELVDRYGEALGG
jgi:hypothetical protein